MEQYNLEEIVLKTINTSKNNIDSKKIINEIKTTINNTFNVLEEANKIDIKNNNGFLVELNTLNNILDLCLNETLIFGNVKTHVKNKVKEYTYGKEITSIGNVTLIFDGNTYTFLELVLRNLIANNTLIVSYNGYMYGTNTYILEVIKETLRKNNHNENQVNQYISDNFYNILNHYNSIDLCLAVGPRTLQNRVLDLSKNRVITSGYENFDLYIESLDNIEFINKILSLNLNIQLYINEELDLNIKDAIYVSNIDEAIAMINNNGSKYSASIFTNNHNNADSFIREVKSHQVLVNTSPTSERLLDIDQSSLCYLKTIIYPEKRSV